MFGLYQCLDPVTGRWITTDAEFDETFWHYSEEELKPALRNVIAMTSHHREVDEHFDAEEGQRQAQAIVRALQRLASLR